MLAAIIVIAVVLVMIVIAVFAIFEVSPFAHHSDSYRDATGHLHVADSPHLETREEFEHRTA